MTPSEAAETRHCPTCGARPGRWCGNLLRNTRIHASRYKAKPREMVR